MEKELKELEKKYSIALKTVYRAKTKLDVKSNILLVDLEEKTRDNLIKKKNFVISGISGVGKTTVSKILKGYGYSRLPNVTTRQKRSKEGNTDYIFINIEEFLYLQKQNMLFDVHLRNGTFHAILKEDLEKMEENGGFFVDKSVSSTKKILERLTQDNLTLIYLLPPSFEELLDRIMLREGSLVNGMEQKEIIERFEEEIDDMRGVIDLPYAFIVNDSLERVRSILKDIL